MCTVGLYVSLCLMIFLCPFLHCKALRTAMYKRYTNPLSLLLLLLLLFDLEKDIDNVDHKILLAKLTSQDFTNSCQT